ncbi:MAG: hypothetical protein CL681_10945 [Blastopirellula sp.]|nr:hypothetical protein [Blastopirellula sp.]
MPRQTQLFIIICILGAMVSTVSAAEKTTSQLVETIRAVGPEGKGHVAAQKASLALANAPVADIPVILAGMDQANALATNWLRIAVDTVAQKAIRRGDSLPQKSLEQFLQNTSHSPRGRRTAYELLLQVDSGAEARYVPTFMQDPSLELRFDAVATALEAAAALAGDEAKHGEALKAYADAFDAARDVKQIKSAAEKIKKLGGEVKLSDHFGFIRHWHLIGPFDNRDKGGFDVVYPPEKEVQFDARYDGSEGEQVGWIETTTDDDFGIVDLNKVLAKHKGAICYAVAEFDAESAGEVDLRLGCINANKLWLNGKLLNTNNVYHAGMEIDQYVVRGQLKPGKNVIVLKIAQNEQEESWAQRWQFQLRVCDAIGTAVLAKNRAQ